MGTGGGGLNILPHKSWNVYSRKNIEKVRRDEAEASRAEALVERAAVAEQQIQRVKTLREAKGLPSEIDTGVNLFEKEEKNAKEFERERKRKEEVDEERKNWLWKFGETEIKLKADGVNPEREWFMRDQRRQFTRRGKPKRNDKEQEAYRDMKEERLRREHDPMSTVQALLTPKSAQDHQHSKHELSRNRLVVPNFRHTESSSRSHHTSSSQSTRKHRKRKRDDDVDINELRSNDKKEKSRETRRELRTKRKERKKQHRNARRNDRDDVERVDVGNDVLDKLRRERREREAKEKVRTKELMRRER